MSTIQFYRIRFCGLLRFCAVALVALPLIACSTSEPAGALPVPETGEIRVLPTPTPEATITPVVDETTAPATSVPLDEDWVQESYGEAWSIGYPAGWSVNDAGAHEGALQLQGDYEGYSYLVIYSYPMGILADTLDAWVEEMLAPLTPEQREAITISDVTVAGTPAKKVLNMPSPDGATNSHHVYIWRSEGKNPRLITITQTGDQPLDSVAMDQLLDRLLLAIQ